MSTVVKWLPPQEGGYWTNAIDSSGRIVAFVSKTGEARIEGKTLLYDSPESAKNGVVAHFNSKGQGKVKDILLDMKGFMHDNRNVIYWLAVGFLVDHFFFGGTFRDRLKACVEKMIGKVEKQIAAK